MKPTKTYKKIPHFTIKFRSKNLIYFTNFDSFNFAKNILLQHSLKSTHFANFPTNMILVGIRKNICTGPFPDAQELRSRPGHVIRALQTSMMILFIKIVSNVNSRKKVNLSYLTGPRRVSADGYSSVLKIQMEISKYGR